MPSDYPFGSFPNASPSQGWPINSLGTIKTDSVGRLLVLAGYGRAGGDKPIDGYGGADTWYDDIADGSVDVTIQFTNGEIVKLQSWVICASPDFAPEIVNISTLDDTMFDVGVRHFNLAPEMYTQGNWNQGFVANYQRDILPIIQRIARYQWVANVQSMSAFWSSIFEFSDPSAKNAANRQRYFSYFRKPTIYTPLERKEESTVHSGATAFQASNGNERGNVALASPETVHAAPGSIEGGSLTLFSSDKIPMMPMNSGSNSVSNVNIEKFLTLNQTQYFLLQQWADGKFTNAMNYTAYQAWPATRAAVGNCVGLPMCPGIEVTWSMQNPVIYAKPYVIAQFGNEESYKKQGLTPSRDETEGGGCEPGDLTKRMAIPWQADFLNCTIQYINFTRDDANKEDRKPIPPTYYAYWWPPQAPWDVITGDESAEQQKESHTPAGLQVNYQRGINSYRQMIVGWSYLGFIRNQNTGSTADSFPYIVETERLHDRFAFKEVPLSEISG
ncbi:MAG TPA: LodA/GoxA family CTQ-dependent oxidase, partial [Ktedonobacteraceae bacterium]|nr:LodA/GoxA family CTQ-dependent oxidase [Ktedonobacteraceae bacterium]